MDFYNFLEISALLNNKNKKVDISISGARRVSGKTFIRYAHTQKIGKPNNFKSCGYK
jgi:hypothetical protein